MAKTQLPSAQDCINNVRQGRIPPVNFLCGEDSFMIHQALDEITRAVDPLIFSEFDKGTFWGGDDKNLNDVLNLASAFPFTSEKKLIVIKDFEKFKDKKVLASYAASPPGFTILVILNNGSISSASTEPFKTLNQKGFIFEAKELKGKNLVQWVTGYVKDKEKIISTDNAKMLVDIVGDNRALIEDQIEKIITFMAARKEVTHNDISLLAAELKENTIFDLMNAVGKKDKSAALRYAFNLLEKGKEAVYIVFMLTRYFITLSRIREITQQNINSYAAARELEIQEWTLKDYEAARKLYSDQQLVRAAEALLNADVSIKTSSADPKTIITILIGEILSSAK
jgi:DNA polymerase III subunit delta